MKRKFKMENAVRVQILVERFLTCLREEVDAFLLERQIARRNAALIIQRYWKRWKKRDDEERSSESKNKLVSFCKCAQFWWSGCNCCCHCNCCSVSFPSEIASVSATPLIKIVSARFYLLGQIICKCEQRFGALHPKNLPRIDSSETSCVWAATNYKWRRWKEGKWKRRARERRRYKEEKKEKKAK